MNNSKNFWRAKVSNQIEMGININVQTGEDFSMSGKSRRARRPAGFWQDHQNIQNELNRVIKELGHFPTQGELASLNEYTLSHILAKSGGTNFWREKLGVDIRKKEKGYWSSEENVERELEMLFSEQQLSDFPSTKQLQKLGRSSLASGIRRTGGFPLWRQKMGFDLKEKPKNFWTSEEVKRQAQEFFDEQGELSQDALTKVKRFDLQVAIGRRYHGGLLALKENLGIEIARKPDGYWNPELIEEEARKFYKERGRLTLGALKRSQRGNLQNAIIAHYPGSIAGLKAKLGIVETTRPPNYWKDIWHIKQEALAFFSKHKGFTHTMLWDHDQNGLSTAIRHYYPGGMRQLKVDLGIENSTHEIVSTDQANEQLEKLLGDETIG